MRLNSVPTRVVLLFMAATSNTWAHGDIACNELKAEWQPQMELQKKLKSAGWKIRMIQTENGCYEVYGFDENKTRIEAFFNPKTLERVG